MMSGMVKTRKIGGFYHALTNCFNYLKIFYKKFFK